MYLYYLVFFLLPAFMSTETFLTHCYMFFTSVDKKRQKQLQNIIYKSFKMDDCFFNF